MNEFVDSTSGTGHSLPTGGELLGHLADAFQLKGLFTADHGWSGSDRTARRYLNGNQRKVSEEKTAEVIEHLVEIFLPDDFLNSVSTEFDEEELTRLVVSHSAQLCLWWDRVAGEVNGYRFPNEDPGDSVLPALRLATFGAALRWGAWQFLVADGTPCKGDREEFPIPWWLDDEPMKEIFDQYRDWATENPTLEEVSKKAGLDFDRITDWRAGKHRPNPLFLDCLAQTLESYSGVTASAEAIEFRLRVASGAAHIRKELDELCSPERIDDLREGFRKVARYTCESLLTNQDNNPDCRDLLPKAREIVARGPHCEWGAKIGPILAESSSSQFVADDLRTLHTDWTERLRFWAKMLQGAPDQQFQGNSEFLQSSGIPAKVLQKMAEGGRREMLRVRDFDAPESERLECILEKLEFDPESVQFGEQLVEMTEKIGLVVRAEAQFARGRFDEGIRLVEKAIEADPEAPYPHYLLGCNLGKVARRQNSTELTEKAIHECEIASALEPEWGRPKHEIGVILSNAGRFEEAEEAFAEAADLNEDWHQHHHGRGRNLMWLGRYDDAISHFERSLELEEDDHRPLLDKGICLMAKGNRREGKKLLRRVGRETGYNLLEDDRWKDVLDGPTNVTGEHPVREEI